MEALSGLGTVLSVALAIIGLWIVAVLIALPLRLRAILREIKKQTEILQSQANLLKDISANVARGAVASSSELQVSPRQEQRRAGVDIGDINLGSSLKR